MTKPRNAEWKTAIDARVASGQKLGLKYLQSLSQQYGIDISQLTAFTSKNNYQLGAKAQGGGAQAQTAAAPKDYGRVDMKGVAELEKYLSGKVQTPTWSPRYEPEGLKQLADYMGIKNLNSEKEYKNALRIVQGANSPFAAASSYGAGVKNYNSLNDYLTTLGGAAPRPSANPTPTTQAAPGGRNGGERYNPEPIPEEELPEEKPIYDNGGSGAGGEKNALSFRSNKSRWKQSGRANKGTSNLKFSRSLGFGGFGIGGALGGISAASF